MFETKLYSKSAIFWAVFYKIYLAMNETNEVNDVSILMEFFDSFS